MCSKGTSGKGYLCRPFVKLVVKRHMKHGQKQGTDEKAGGNTTEAFTCDSSQDSHQVWQCKIYRPTFFSFDVEVLELPYKAIEYGRHLERSEAGGGGGGIRQECGLVRR